MAKRKRKSKQQIHVEEISFSCAGCYDRAQKGLRKAKIPFKTSFRKSLFFVGITDEIKQILGNLSCKSVVVSTGEKLQ